MYCMYAAWHASCSVSVESSPQNMSTEHRYAKPVVVLTLTNPLMPRALIKSEAILRIGQGLALPINVVSALLLMLAPRFFADVVYD